MGAVFGRGNTFTLDHELDDVPFGRKDSYASSISTIPDKRDLAEDTKEQETLIETPAEKKARKRSHLVAYATMFVMSVGFSIVLTGVYPYMKQIDNSLDKTALGLVVAANPFGQMIASPLLGFWGYKMGSIRLACITTIICFIIGNVFYSLLSIFNDISEHSAYYFMIFFRFLVGVSSANVTLCRSYLAQSTTLKERTAGIAIIAASQALGFVVGPAIQAILALSIKDGIDTGVDWLVWDKYTAAGWIAALLGFVNLVLMMPCVFQEHNLAKTERSMLKEQQKTDNSVTLKPNYYVVFGITAASFSSSFILSFFETLLVPFTMDQYAWTDDKAVMIISLATSCSGIITLVMYVFVGPLSKRFQERKIIILGGFIPMFIGSIFFIPFGYHEIPLANCTAINTTTTTSPIENIENVPSFLHQPNTPLLHLQSLDFAYKNTLEGYSNYNEYVKEKREDDEDLDCGPGCPPSQEWCETVSKLPQWQLLTGFIFIFMSTSISRAMPLAMYTKVLGPNPQQMWIAFIAGVNTIARIVGPIITTYLYTNLGTYWLFGFTSSLMGFALILYFIMYKWLVPMKSLQDLETKIKA